MKTLRKMIISRPLLEFSGTILAAYIAFKYYSSSPVAFTLLLVLGTIALPIILKKPEYLIFICAIALPFRDIHLVSILYVKRLLIWGSFGYLLLLRMNQLPTQFPFRYVSQFTKAVLFFLVALIISLIETVAALHSMVAITTVEVKASLFFYGPLILDQLALVYLAYYGLTSWTHIRRLIDVTLVVSVIISLLGILQYILNGHVPYLEAFYNADITFYGRATSVFPNPNDLGCYLVVMFVSAVICGVTSTQPKKKYVLYVPISLLCLLGMFLSFSRGAILQTFLSLFTVGVIYYCWLSQKRFSRQALISVILFILSSSLSVYLYDTYMRMRLIGYREGAYQQALYVTHHTNDYLRRYAALQAVKTFSSHPVFGIGFGLFSPKQLAYGLSPHNQYLKILAEMGGIGFVSFLLMIFIPIKTCIRSYRNVPDNTSRGIFLVALSGSITTLFGYLFSDALASMPISGYLWLSFGSIFVLERELSPARKHAIT
ncbi:O-antigen polymerase [Candidatus Moduliflexus flocculans]|uniref:O-antigen polymerase n=1 Tax=Candidatus Moduliflexus flocculans TaxID=1499966 RepID=A0A081BNE6_9BACT|nr:O-antigen polymerase [Candidatus Moduliflexus flocculans]